MVTDPLLQILLVVFQVDQTRVFPSTTLLLLPSTGQSQIPKTAARSSPDMQNPKRKAEEKRTFRKPPERKHKLQTERTTRNTVLLPRHFVGLEHMSPRVKNTHQYSISTRSHSRHLEPNYTGRDNTLDS